MVSAVKTAVEITHLFIIDIYQRKVYSGVCIMADRNDIRTPVLLALLLALTVKFFAFDFMLCDGVSMESAVKNGSILIVSRLSYGLRNPFSRTYLFMFTPPKKGDIVVFYTPHGDIAVKRIASIDTHARNFFAEGDNKANSYDSRAYGEVSINSIIGKVLNPLRGGTASGSGVKGGF
jgi:signal peptidase I